MNKNKHIEDAKRDETERLRRQAVNDRRMKLQKERLLDVIVVLNQVEDEMKMVRALSDDVNDRKLIELVEAIVEARRILVRKVVYK